jgi:FMN phosphatase YigB (HAD superfamily)
MRRMYDAVIFDFFGVFCNSIASDWFKKTVPNYQSKLADLQALCTQSDYGKLTLAEFTEQLAELAGTSPAVAAAGMEAEKIINTSLVNYAGELKAKGYRLACLSNGTQELTLRTMDDNGLGHLFEVVVLSADVGLIKPEPHIYLHTLDQLGIAAHQAIFVDDRKDNTEGAEACGIRSLVFIDTPRFIADFELLADTDARSKSAATQV